MVTELVILGAGGFAREASLLVEELNESNQEGKIKLIGFIDDDQAKWGLKHRGYEVLGGWEALDTLSEFIQVICVIGDPADKKKMVEKALERKRRIPNLVHPGVVLNGGVTLGSGVLINKGTILTTNILIGDHVSINPCCGIGHDSMIGSFSTLMWRVNISGNVKIGGCCLIGSGATVFQGLKIGRGVTIAAGAVVTKDLPDGCTAAGVPARVIQKSSTPWPSPAMKEGD
jgi:sugar O-acyltransferase (sialic acid O-acetyltransferase NeuD family)